VAGIWTAPLKRHPAGTVAPFSMLVPVVGIAAAAWLVLDEQEARGDLARVEGASPCSLSE
jgi:O-acetylserine/cysteine efflux transporter